MDKFNIAQGPAINDRTWVVIDGQRMPQGHLAAGAKTIMDGLSREDALGFALLLNNVWKSAGSDLLEHLWQHGYLIRETAIHLDKSFGAGTVGNRAWRAAT